jgi:hypothetical protein
MAADILIQVNAAPHAQVTLFWDGSPVGGGEADVEGFYQETIELPGVFSVGDHEITAKQTVGWLTSDASAVVHVTGIEST